MSDNITVSVRDKDVLNINMQSESALNMEVKDGVPKLVHDYDLLINKPSIDGHVLEGDSSFAEIGIPYVFYATTEEWNSQPSLLTIAGAVYIYSDYETVDGEVVAGIKIGDGTSYLYDMPFSDKKLDFHINDTNAHISAEDRARWDNKVRCYLSSENVHNLVFTTN